MALYKLVSHRQSCAHLTQALFILCTGEIRHSTMCFSFKFHRQMTLYELLSLTNQVPHLGQAPSDFSV
jgi:hypothetical protein